MHIIGLVLDYAFITTLTDAKTIFVRQLIKEYNVDPQSELFKTCVEDFHGIQPRYLREYTSIEVRQLALEQVNRMITADPNCEINERSKLMLSILPRVLGL